MEILNLLKMKNEKNLIAILGLSILGLNNLYSQNSQNQDFVKIDTLAQDYAKYKINLFEIEMQEIFALDANNNKFSDQVIKKTINKRFFWKQSLQIEKWINYDDEKNQIFDKYEIMRKEYNFFGKEKYFGTAVSEDTIEINKSYSLPMFDGKIFEIIKDSNK